MSYWNYRILHDGELFWVGEVYYDDNGIAVGYTDASKDTLRWDDKTELLGAIAKIASDTAKHPVLKVNPKTEEILGDM
jgi:hypothetical protein